LIQDSVTIIILGNKYNRNIYQAKKLANIFSPYFDTYEEERPENSTESPAANNTSVNKNKTKKF
ncbi:MAG: hypothetical protein M3Y85_09710, partial [Bacteroidota bacterium]|nr:hypothetical protein [Bacteroidota bacterium]